MGKVKAVSIETLRKWMEEPDEINGSVALLNTSTFFPTTFKEYIGQTKIKTILSQYIKATKQRNMVFPHCLIHGKPGSGKTTLARIMAKVLGVPFKETITSNIEDFTVLLDLIKSANGGIVFLDEIHGLERGVAEQLYTMMENFTYNGMPIQPFTLIGATTELGEIIKDRKPFYDRFKIVFELDSYSEPELIKIAKQYQKNMFPLDQLDHSTYIWLSKNAREVPRQAIKLLEALIFFEEDIDAVRVNFNLLKDGFTKKDLSILQYLSLNGLIGVQGLASYLDTSMENYLYEIEPFLLRRGVIARTPRGRNITEKGKEMITYLGGAE